MENIVKTYPCGLRTIIRPMRGFKSTVVSIYVRVGSRDEQPNEYGLSHFCEHMLFKGTETRTSEQIAASLSNLGVDYNAFTTTGATCYHTRGLNGHLDTCCDVLSDMYFNAKFTEADFHREAEVICQEIAMYEDQPFAVLGELVAQTFFHGTPYGHSIAGTQESVKSFKPADIYNYIKKHYTAPRTIVSFAGDITPAQAEEMIKKYFLPRFGGTAAPALMPLADRKLVPPSQVAKREKEFEQQSVAILFPTINNNHPDKYVLEFVNGIFSSDMSSRLFTSVRDKLGLVYRIRGGVTLTPLGGYYYISFSCTPKNTEKVLRAIADEVHKLKNEGVTPEEITKVKNIINADCLFLLENVEGISQTTTRLLSEFNRIETVSEYLAKINAVTKNDIMRAIKTYLYFSRASVAVVGKGIKVKPFEHLK